MIQYQSIQKESSIFINFSSEKIVEEFCSKGINIRKINENIISLTLDEKTTVDDVVELVSVFASINKCNFEAKQEDFQEINIIPEFLKRKQSLLEQQIFNTFNSETQLMRYIKKLEGKDYGLTNGMIPLGSCTMKLNPASTMVHSEFT